MRIPAESPAMPATSGYRIPTSTAVQEPRRDGNTRALPHLGTPDLAPERSDMSPPGGHWRHDAASLHFLALVLLGVAEGLDPVSASSGEGGDTLEKSPVYRRADI